MVTHEEQWERAHSTARDDAQRSLADERLIVIGELHDDIARMDGALAVLRNSILRDVTNETVQARLLGVVEMITDWCAEASRRDTP